MVLNRQALAEHIVCHADDWTDQARRNTAITALMLTADAEIVHAGHRVLDAGKCRIDARLIADLYAACPPGLKIALVSTPAIAYLEPSDFKPLFLEAYQQRPMKVLQRREFAYSLQMFLMRHPNSVDDYEHIILALLRSSEYELSLQGVRLTGFLNKLARRDLALMQEKLRSRKPGFRMNALNAFCDMLKRPLKLDSGLLTCCTSKEMKSLFRRMRREDRNEAVRLSARYVLKALMPTARR